MYLTITFTYITELMPLLNGAYCNALLSIGQFVKN